MSELLALAFTAETEDEALAAFNEWVAAEPTIAGHIGGHIVEDIRQPFPDRPHWWLVEVRLTFPEREQLGFGWTA